MHTSDSFVTTPSIAGELSPTDQHIGEAPVADPASVRLETITVPQLMRML